MTATPFRTTLLQRVLLRDWLKTPALQLQLAANRCISWGSNNPRRRKSHREPPGTSLTPIICSNRTLNNLRRHRGTAVVAEIEPQLNAVALHKSEGISAELLEPYLEDVRVPTRNQITKRHVAPTAAALTSRIESISTVAAYKRAVQSYHKQNPKLPHPKKKSDAYRPNDVKQVVAYGLPFPPDAVANTPTGLDDLLGKELSDLIAQHEKTIHPVDLAVFQAVQAEQLKRRTGFYPPVAKRAVGDAEGRIIGLKPESDESTTKPPSRDVVNAVRIIYLRVRLVFRDELASKGYEWHGE